MIMERSQARISLAQWQALLAVVDAGGYAQAADMLHKSPSSLNAAIHKMEELLGIKVFVVKGRKAELTATGHMLVRRARLLLAEAGELESAARKLSEGWEAEVRLAVDHLFPVDCLFAVLAEFSAQAPLTRIDLRETVLSGGDEALLQGEVDLAVLPQAPPGFLGEPLMTVDFVAVAHPQHPLHEPQRALGPQDVRSHRQLVIRDSGRTRLRDAGWLGAEQRWTVSHMSTSIRAVRNGLGFAWFPRHRIADELASGVLKPLPLREGAERRASLELVFRDRDYAGPATRELARLLRAKAREPGSVSAAAQ
ncbi:MAG: LysR family transcriptional regulator [Oceanococcaceae bacterium]